MGCAGFPAIAPAEAERWVADKAGIKPGPRSKSGSGPQGCETAARDSYQGHQEGRIPLIVRRVLLGRPAASRYIPPAPPVTRCGFIIDAESQKCDSENVTCFRYRASPVLRPTDSGLSADTMGHNSRRLVLGSFCGPFHFWVGAEVSMLNVKDANSKAYTEFIRFPRTEVEVSEKLGLPLWRVTKTLNLLRALTIAEQRDDGKWVKSDWPSA